MHHFPGPLCLAKARGKDTSTKPALIILSIHTTFFLKIKLVITQSSLLKVSRVPDSGTMNNLIFSPLWYYQTHAGKAPGRSLLSVADPTSF